MAQFSDSWRAGGKGNGAYTLQSRTSSQVPLIVKGFSGQTANLFEAQNSAGSAVFSIDNSGNITFSGTATISIDEAVTGNLTVTGNSTFNGNTTIGNAASDTLTVTATATFAERIVATNGINASGTSYFGGTAIFNNATKFADGTVTDPSITFQNYPTTGFYLPSANAISATTAGVQRMVWGATTYIPTSATNKFVVGGVAALTGSAGTFISTTNGYSPLSINNTAANGFVNFDFYDSTPTQVAALGYSNASAGSFTSQMYAWTVAKDFYISTDSNATRNMVVAATSGAATFLTKVTAGGVNSFTITPGAHTSVASQITAFTVSDHSLATSGAAITTNVSNSFGSPTFTGSSVVTNAFTTSIALPTTTSGQTAQTTNVRGLNLGSAVASVTVNNVAGTTLGLLGLSAQTFVLDAATGVTGNNGFAGIQVPVFTINSGAGGAVTLDFASGIYVAGPPSGTATITNPYSIFVDAGLVRFDGGIIGGTQTALGTGYLLDLKNSSSANVTMATTNSNSAGFAQMALFNNSGDSSVIDVFGSTYVTAAFQRNTLLGAGRSLYITSNSSGGLSTATINLYTGGNPATPEFTMAGPTGNATFSALASTSGSPAVFTITAPAHTTLAKNTEAVDVNINLARTVQFATVDTAFITQRAMLVQAPTYGFVGASTITVASTFSVTGGPLAGTNATISTGIGINSDSWGGTNATDVAALFSIPSIATSIGNVTERSALKITNGPSNILGDQTANLTNLYSINLTATTFTSTTNVRTVTGNVANLYIEGPHVASTNVTFANTPYSIFVDAGSVRFDGDFVFGSKGIDTTAGDSATVNGINGRFRKDTTGTTFTLTNSFITANSIIQLTYASDPGITGFDAFVVAGAGSATITFTTSGVAAAPTSNADVNFIVIN